MTVALAQKTLRELLADAGSRWVEADWTAPKNDCIDYLIDRFDDCPEALQDFFQSDWVNLCEPYTYNLVKFYQRQAPDVRALFESACDAYGFTSAAEALEGSHPEDPEDYTAAFVNFAMTFAAQELCREVFPDF